MRIFGEFFVFFVFWWIVWEFFRKSSGILWELFRISLGFIWEFLRIFLRILWEFYWNPWEFFGISFGLLCKFWVLNVWVILGNFDLKWCNFWLNGGQQQQQQIKSLEALCAIALKKSLESPFSSLFYQNLIDYFTQQHWHVEFFYKIFDKMVNFHQSH